MKEITPEMVREAYLKKGMIPMQGMWHWSTSDGDEYGCAVTALVKGDRGYDLDSLNSAYRLFEVEDTRGRVYVCGFVTGFDGGAPPKSEKFVNDPVNTYLAAMDGYRLGVKTWEAVEDLADNIALLIELDKGMFSTESTEKELIAA